MEGYLFPDVESGDRVQVNLEEGELLMENGKEVKYIRLKIRKSKNNSVRFRFYFGCCLIKKIGTSTIFEDFIRCSTLNVSCARCVGEGVGMVNNIPIRYTLNFYI